MRHGRCLLTLVVILLALPETAAATSITKSGNKYVYTGDSGPNNVSVRFSGHIETQTIVFYEYNVDQYPSFPAECTSGAALDGRAVGCPAEGITGVELSTLAGSDHVRSDTVDDGVARPLTILLGADTDSGEGNSANDVIQGGDGTDTIVNSPGNDFMSGDGGEDTIRYNTLPADGLVSITLGTSTGGNGSGSESDTLGLFENVRCECEGGATIHGDDGPNEIDASTTDAAGVTVHGNGGDDRIEGARSPTQADHLEGGPGDDEILAELGPDVIFGDDGVDYISADYGDPGDDVHCGAGLDFPQFDENLDNVAADCDLPGVVITSGPTGTTAQQSAAFEFAAPGDVRPGRFECKLDGEAYATCVSPKGYAALSAGEHTFRVRRVPTGSSPGPAASRVWTIDTGPPTVTIDSAPSGGSNGPEATILFHASEPSTFRCQLDLQPATDCSSPYRLLGLGVGAHTLTITATDTAGNESAPAATSWTVAAGGSGGGGPEVPAGDCPAGSVPRVEFGVIQAVARGGPASCFALVNFEGEQVRASSGDIAVNGVLFDPPPGTMTIVDGQLGNGTIRTTGPLTLRFGSVPLPIPLPILWSGAAQNVSSKVFSILGSGPNGNDGLTFLGLALREPPTFTLAVNGGVGETKVGLGVKFPTFLFSAVPGGTNASDVAVTAGLSATVTNKPSVSYAANVGISQAWLFGRLPLRDIKLAIDSDGPKIAGEAAYVPGWSPTSPFTASTAFKAQAELGTNGFLGPLRKLALEASNINKPIGTTGLFLSKFGGSFARMESPQGLQLSATAGVSLGPSLDLGPIFNGRVISLDGTVTQKVPSAPSIPWSIKAEGKGAVVEVPVAEASVEYVSGTQVNFAGKLDFTAAGWGLLAEVTNSWVNLEDFNVEGKGQLAFPGLTSTGEAEVVISSRGMAACVGDAGGRFGFGKLWNQDLRTFFFGCDVGGFRAQPARAAAAQAGEQTVRVAKGTRVKVIALKAASASPKVRVTGPGDFAVETPATAAGVNRPDVMLVQDPVQKTTFVVLRMPRAGVYVARPLAGDYGLPFELRTATNLPRVSVRARVRGGRLHWRLRRIPGQQVRFADIGPGVTRIVATTNRARGSARLRPAPGRHLIAAQISQGSLPRVNLTVARYSGKKLTEVKRLRLRGRRLSWRKQASAAAYAVALVRRDGFTISRTVRKVRLKVASSVASATVVALDVAGGFGPAARVRR